ncbi:MAG: S-adenosyl-l-methionine hydroxide adenosyltransferase family protein [Thermoplasmatota archaeon]
MNVITFLSDFGSRSSYVAQMKGVALSIAPQVKCIDITHEVPSYNVRNGAFILRSAAPYFPKGTVHVAVVDPGVGTDRRGIVVITQSQIFVGPDNGLLIPAARMFGTFFVYEIKNAEMQGKIVSNTFHGRDIFAPIAAHILSGISFQRVGPQIQDFVDLSFSPAVRNEGIVDANVLCIDGFGNIITNVEHNQIQDVLQPGRDISLIVGKKKTSIRCAEFYGMVKPGEPLATIGSSGYLEININQGNAAKVLNICAEDRLILDFSNVQKDFS